MLSLHYRRMYPDGRRFHLSRIQGGGPWSYPRHCNHDFWEAILMRDGVVRHEIGGEELTTAAGQLILLAPGATHGLSGREFHFYNLNFQRVEFQAATRYLGFEPGSLEGLPVAGGHRQIELGSSRQSAIGALMEELLCVETSERRRMSFRRLLLAVLVEFRLSPEAEGASDPMPGWLSRLLETIERQFSADLTPADFAGLANRSQEHVSRSFRRHLGTTPSTWLNRVRIKRAARLLANSNLEIAAVAYEVGFENLGYFYRLFQEMWGVAPGAYRREHPRAGI